MTLVAGIDGCPAGWLMVSQRPDGEISARLLNSIQSLDSWPTFPQVLGIDIPIGLPEAGPRACDSLARKLLGWPRSSSVFPAPIRSALHAADRREANAITRAKDGRGVGAQAWAIYRRVAEVDRFLLRNPGLRARIFEVHPELSFMRMNDGSPIDASKHSVEGLKRRRARLKDHFGAAVYPQLRDEFRRHAVSDDDICDALAVLWTAQCINQGTARSVPKHEETDGQGLRMAIWF